MSISTEQRTAEDVSAKRRDRILALVAATASVCMILAIFWYQEAPSPSAALQMSDRGQVSTLEYILSAFVIVLMVTVVGFLARTRNGLIVAAFATMGAIIATLAVCILVINPSNGELIQNWANERYSLHLTEDQAGDLADGETVTVEDDTALRFFEAQKGQYVLVDASDAQRSELPH